MPQDPGGEAGKNAAAGLYIPPVPLTILTIRSRTISIHPVL